LLEKSIVKYREDLSLIKYPVYISTEKEHALFINGIYKILTDFGIQIFVNHPVDIIHDIDMKNRILSMTDTNKIEFNDIIIATGRNGYNQTQAFFDINGVSRKEENINFGVRYMVPSKYLNAISKLHPDFKVKFETLNETLETFCFSNGSNGGHVDFLRYNDFLNLDGHIAVGSMGDRRNDIIYGNFAVLYKNKERNSTYKEIAGRINKINIPKSYRDSIKYSTFASGHSKLSSFFSGEEFKSIINFSEDIFVVMADINKVKADDLRNNIYVYGPEVENIWPEIKIRDTSFRIANNIIAIGDCTGLAQGAVSSMAMGYKAGEMYGK
jgi:uncharacterized FAD-dependent dehydrogenase